MLPKLGNTPNKTRMGVCSITLFLLIFAWPSQASETEQALENLFSAVNGSAVLVRTREHSLIGNNNIGVVPFTDQGSGVLISEDGDVLTAAHLVQVEFGDGTMVRAEIITSEPAAVLAMLRFERVPEGAVIVAKSSNAVIGK